jgi:hypothetical protein
VKIEIIRCDKCKDSIRGQMFSVTGPFIHWDFCQGCYELLKSWINAADVAEVEEDKANGDRTLQTM